MSENPAAGRLRGVETSAVLACHSWGQGPRPSAESDRSLACCGWLAESLLAWRLERAAFERGAMTMLQFRAGLRVAVAVLCLGLINSPAQSQGLGGAGMVQGTVKDPTGGVMQAVQVRISNPVTGFSRTVTTDATGKYVFSN